jgi:hypothetical protein
VSHRRPPHGCLVLGCGRRFVCRVALARHALDHAAEARQTAVTLHPSARTGTAYVRPVPDVLLRWLEGRES